MEKLNFENNYTSIDFYSKQEAFILVGYPFIRQIRIKKGKFILKKEIFYPVCEQRR